MSEEVTVTPDKPRQQGLEPLTKDKWKALTDKAKWDCMVALRGPDCKNPEPIKWMTCSVIRGKLRNVMRVGGSVNKDLNLIVYPHDYHGIFNHVKMDPKLPSCIQWKADHYFEHIVEAAYHLGIPTMEVPTLLWLEVVSTKSRCNAVSHLILKLTNIPVQEWNILDYNGEYKEPVDLQGHISELSRHVANMPSMIGGIY